MRVDRKEKEAILSPRMPASILEEPVIDIGRTGGVLTVGREPLVPSDVALRAGCAIEAERRNLLLQVPMPTALLVNPFTQINITTSFTHF